MKKRLLLRLAIIALVLSACSLNEPACSWTSGTPRYLANLPSSSPTPGHTPTPALVQIGGRSILVDRIIEGPLCNDTLSGTVYVSCNVQVLAWEEDPLFFKDCNLTIEPGTVVYVAYHHDAAYYNGCSCHTGLIVESSSLEKETKNEK